LTRGAHPEIAHDPRNINILCFESHNRWENGDRERMRIYPANMRLIELLKSEYQQLRLMRTKKRTPDFGAISRLSIKKDFQRVQRYPAEEKRPQIEELPKINAERRIIHISEVSGYAKFARYIVGKLVRLKEKANVGGNSWYCEFVHDDDRKALNMAAGWSDNKKLYLLDGIKFK
jgi:hypothetical protein